MYNYMVKQLQIQPLGPLSDLFNPDLDIFQGITLVFRETVYERDQTMYNYIVAKIQKSQSSNASYGKYLGPQQVT